MSLRYLTIPLAFVFGVAIAHAQSHSLFISGNVMTGQTWNAASSSGNGSSGSCTTTSNVVQYYSAPFYTDLTDNTYSLHLYYESFQSGFVYLYQDSFNPSDPCNGEIVFGYAPLANIYNIHLDANRQYFFVTSEDVLYGGGGSFQVTIDGPASSHLFLGGPPSTHVPFCFGDGSSAACPCGNNGTSSTGCGNSVNASGASLSGNGVASIAGDTLLLNGTGMPNGTALYFQGTMQVNGGIGATFGDGLRCVGGVIRRLGAKSNVGGSSAYPASGEAPISIKGANNPGDVRYYQCWYRDPAAFCTPATFNMTNALKVTWIP